MAKYLVKASYTTEALGALAENGTGPFLDSLNQMTEALGGRIESYHFAFGDVDAYAIVDYPDTTAGAAAALIAGVSPMVDVETVPLLTPDEVDAALQAGKPILERLAQA